MLVRLLPWSRHCSKSEDAVVNKEAPVGLSFYWERQAMTRWVHSGLQVVTDDVEEVMCMGVEQGFTSLTPLPFWAEYFFAVRDHPVHRRMFSCIPDLPSRCQ